MPEAARVNAHPEAAGVAPGRSRKLTPQQRHALESLSTAASRLEEEVVSAHLALSSAFLGTAAAFAEELAVAWPTQLAEAAEAHLRVVLERHDVYPS